MMSDDDNDGQMIFGDLGGLKLPDMCLTGEEKPRKKSHPGNLPRPGIEPGPAACQTRILPLAPQRWTIGLELNGKHLLPDYADDVNMLGEYLQNVRENTEIFIKAILGHLFRSKFEKINYMLK